LVKNKTLISIIKIMFIFVIALVVLGVLAVFVILPRIIKGEEVEVPNLVGKTKDECITILKEHNLQLDLNIEEREDSLVKAGIVIEQEPPAGFNVKVGKHVHIVVSSGAQLVEVPNVIGEIIEDAESILNRSNLIIGYKARVHSQHYPQKNSVIAQTPLAGTYLPRGSKVSLLISLGGYKEIYVLPEFKGMKFSEVRKMLNKYRLEIGDVVYNQKTPVQSGIVLSHIPGKGQLISAGESIDFEVSGTERAQISEEQPRAVIISYTVPKDLGTEPINIRIDVEDSFGIKTVIDGNYYPGTLIQRPYSVTGDAKMKVYINQKNTPIYEEDL